MAFETFAYFNFMGHAISFSSILLNVPISVVHVNVS